MSLFPAYAHDDVVAGVDIQVTEVSPAREAQLLESEEERSPSPAARAPPRPPAPRCDDFYLDPKSDYGNLRVSTLYYPGRPQYARGETTLGRSGAAARRGPARRRRRYFECAGAEPPRADDELAARVAAFRRMLADAPHDVDLWLRFIRFQERCNGTGAALETAVEGVSRAPHSRALHVAHHRLARAHLPADTYLTVLRDNIAKEKSPAAASSLWIRLVETLASSPAACSAHAVAAAARAAARHTLAYPHLVAAYGSFLRAAGLWELLTMLVELVAAMSFPPSPAFPPPYDDARDAAVEDRLLALEDEVAVCGLPLTARWVRVERARAAAHWRTPRAAHAHELRADPQRAPHPADLADLLLPVADARAAFLLAAQLLRLAKVPALPAAGWLARALGPADDGAEALLPLLRAARRLPAAHPARPARPAHAARLLALLLDPPHYFSDDAGFLSWVGALWEASFSWTRGDEREALLCWWLRWLQTLAALADPDEESGRAELRRIRGMARAGLRAHAGASVLPFAQFARLERLCAGAAPAAAAARRAARQALRDPDLSLERRLYVARVAAEMGQEAGGLWAVVCAALGRPLPPDDELRAPPPPPLRDAALLVAEERCAALERDLGDLPDDDEACPGAACAALLPGAGEWAAARAQLAGPARLRTLYQRAVGEPPAADAGWRSARYHEQAACALAAAARAHHSLAPYARRLAPLYPHNGFLAVASSGLGAEAWARRETEAGGADADALRQTQCGALADLLPALLRAVAANESGSSSCATAAWRALARRARRAARGGGGALAWAALLEAAARADAPALAPERLALPATDACPAHKWLYVRGAAGCGGGAGAALADAALDRALRLHALPDELAAAADAAAECLAPHAAPPV